VHHGVRIKDSAIVRRQRFPIAISLTVPTDKAIDLIDEAALRYAYRSTPCPLKSSARTQGHSIGDRTSSLEERRRPNSRERLAVIDRELPGLGSAPIS